MQVDGTGEIRYRRTTSDLEVLPTPRALTVFPASLKLARPGMTTAIRWRMESDEILQLR